MIKFDELKFAELEISSRCQASCPMCSRNIRGGGTNENLKLGDWTFENFNKILTNKVLRQLKEIMFCGSYGDPIMNNDFLNMVRQSCYVNPKLKISVNTNASARTTNWWKELGGILKNQDHEISFALDGLEDTHAIYRIGTDYNKILENAKAFISAGGRATWQFILFKHNEHQVEIAKKLSKELNFWRFELVDSYRFAPDTKFEVYDSQGNFKYNLEKSDASKIVKFSDEGILKYKEILNNTEISCQAKNEGKIYIDVNYHLYPCCFIAGTMYNSRNHWEPIKASSQEIINAWRDGQNEAFAQCHRVVDRLGGFNSIDLTKNSLEKILNGSTYTEVWNGEWKGNDKNLRCAATCGKTKEVNWSTSTDQYSQ